MSNRSVRLPLIAIFSVLAAPAPAAPPESRDPRDAVVRRMDRYFSRHEVDGVVLDARWVLNETEAVRLSVTPQLLGYVELERRHPGHARDIQDRADYLLARLDQVRSGSVFDGMLAYALLEAHGVTGDPAHLAAARAVLDALEAIPASERVLNGGLMAAMGFARESARTGDPRYAQMTRDIVAGLAPYQNEDGSFPHWCGSSADVHYTGWMAQELILIGRLVDDPAIEPLLARMSAFLEARVGDDGVTRYQGPCPDGPPGCVRNYWSLGTGCSIDVETRAFTNELGYTALLFDHVGSPELPAVLAFLDSIEDGGVVADRWEGPIDPKDPYYPWTAADTSIVNMSLLFWSLAAMPPAHGPDRAIATPSPPHTLAIAPNPASGRVMIEAPARGGAHAAGTILDIRGRIVRTWTGPAFAWDGRDTRGMTCPRGVYLVELRADGGIARGRVVLAGDR